MKEVRHLPVSISCIARWPWWPRDGRGQAIDVVWLGHCLANLVVAVGDVPGSSRLPLGAKRTKNMISSLKLNSTLNHASLVGKLDGSRTNSYAINNHEKPCSTSRHLCRWFKFLAHFSDIRRSAIDDTQHAALPSFYSASNGLASTSNPVFTSKDGCVQELSFLIGTTASPLTPQSLIKVYDNTQGYQKQGTRTWLSPILGFG